ncbi:hypothetical protein Plhal703r1_c66g0169021 [Plasmopara halstedii]
MARRFLRWLSSADLAAIEDGEAVPGFEKVSLVDTKSEKYSAYSIQKMLQIKGLPSPQTEQNHVLVVVPEGAVGSASEVSGMDQVIQEVHEIHAQTVLTKRKTYVHSKMGSTEYEELLDAFKIKEVPLRKKNARWREEVEGFTWDMNHIEDKQKNEYRKYVEDNIGEDLRAMKLCVFAVENTTDILRVAVEGSNIELRGRTDLLILSDIVMESADYVHDLPEVRMLIEVKKTVERRSVFQAMSELIALELMTTDQVFALLTDFNDDWRFFWVAGKENNITVVNRVTITNPGEAFELIRQLLSPNATTDITTSVLQDPVKRQKLSRVLPSISEAGGSGGICESIERYYDIASCLGPDFDMARAVARQVTRSIPTLSYFS